MFISNPNNIGFLRPWYQCRWLMLGCFVIRNKGFTRTSSSLPNDSMPLPFMAGSNFKPKTFLTWSRTSCLIHELVVRNVLIHHMHAHSNTHVTHTFGHIQTSSSQNFVPKCDSNARITSLWPEPTNMHPFIRPEF